MDKAFESIENLDSDNDGFTNIEEIRNLTFIGDEKDFPNKKNKTKNVKSNVTLFDFIYAQLMGPYLNKYE
jgi:hypothetical protein